MHKDNASAATNTNAQAKFSHFEGITRGEQHPTHYATPSDLAGILTASEPKTRQALQALQDGNTGGYRAAKFALPMLTAAIYEGGTPRESGNVRGFSACFVEFDCLQDVTATFDNIRQALPEVPGLLACFATGKGIRFMFRVPSVRLIGAAGAATVRAQYGQVWQHIAADLAARFPQLPKPDASASKPEQFQAVWNRPGYVYIAADTAPVAFQYTRPATTAIDTAPQELAVWQPATLAELEALTAAAELKGRFAAVESHEGWKSITAAIANVYGEEGREIAVRLAQIPTAYRGNKGAADTRRLFNNVLDSRYAGSKAGFGSIRRAFQDENLHFKTSHREVTPVTGAETIQVKEFLSEAFDKIADRIKGCKGIPVVKAPTGSGKTAWAAKYIRARAKESPENMGHVHVIVSPYTETVRQHADREELAAVRVGVKPSELYLDICSNINTIITTPDGVHKILAAGGQIKTLIIDELHDWATAVKYRSRYVELIDVAQRVRAEGGEVIGMTATPQTELLMSLAELGGGYAAEVIQIDRPTKTKYTLRWAVAPQNQVVAYLARRAGEGVRMLVHIDRKQDRKAGKSVHDIAAQMQDRGIDTQTATADDVSGIPKFQGGEGAMLIGTSVICNGLDIDAEGQVCEVIQYVTAEKGLQCEALAQLGGRFRNAKEVRFTIIVATPAYLLPSEMRQNPGPVFDLNNQYNKAHQTALAIKERRKARRYEKEGTAAAGRLEGIREVDGFASVNVLAVAGQAIDERNRRGGLPAFIKEFEKYVDLAEAPEAIDLETAFEDKITETAFTAFCGEISTDLEGVNVETLNTFDLNIKAKADGPSAALANSFINRFNYDRLTDPLGWLVNKICSPEIKAKAETPEGRDWLKKWVQGRDGLLNAVYSLIKAVPPEATKGDLHELFNTAFAEGGRKWKAGALSLTRSQYVLNQNLEGGVTRDVPAEVLHGLDAADFIDYAAEVKAALPAIRERLGDQPATGAEILSAVRELTSLPVNCRQAMTIVRNLVEVQNKTVLTADGTARTTAYLLGAEIKRSKFNQSYTARDAIVNAVERGATKHAAKGVDPKRIFRFPPTLKMREKSRPVQSLGRAGAIAAAVFDPVPDDPF